MTELIRVYAIKQLIAKYEVSIMKKLSLLKQAILLFSVCSSLLLWVSKTHAESNEKTAEIKQVQINWHEPENYRDVRSPDGGQKRYRERVFKQLDKHFQKMASKHLPDNYSLKVKMTNVDLAGDARFYTGGINNFRVLKDIHWPSMEFEYQLFEDHKLIKKDAMKVKDMSYLQRIGLRSQSESFYYDKRLISEWFKDEIPETLSLWQKQKTAIMSE